MTKLPVSGWALVLVMLSGTGVGATIVVLDIYSWGLHPVRLSAGTGISTLCFVCLVGIFKRKVIAKFIAIAVMIIGAAVVAGISLFFLVVGQQEPDVMEWVRNGLIASFFLFVFSVVGLFSKKLKTYFKLDERSS